MKYICHNIFMIRTPHLPLECWEQLCKVPIDSIWEYVQKQGLQDYISEALLISTPSLYDALLRRGLDKRKDKAANMSLYKYLLRAATRTTPYGLFADVSLGEFKGSTTESLLKNGITKNICADNLWIFQLIREIESNSDNVKKLSLKWNPSCVSRKSRVWNFHYANGGSNATNSIKPQNSIRESKLVGIIKHYTQKGIKYKELKDIIKNVFPNAEEGVIDKTIQTLIEYEYIFTDLRIPAYCEDKIEHVLDILKKHDIDKELQLKIQKIKESFEEYEKSTEGEQVLTNLICDMEALHKSDVYVEVNSGSKIENPLLSTEVKERVEKFVDCLSEIGLESVILSTLWSFKARFQEEYGQDVEVPLLEVIDPNGFDGLRFYNNPRRNMTVRDSKIRTIIECKLQSALVNGRNKVELTKEDFLGVNDDFLELQENAKWVSSFDLNFIITKDESRLNLALGPNIGANDAGKTFRRFERTFNTDKLKEYDEIYKTSESEFLTIEVREMPALGRLANVFNETLKSQYFLPLGMPCCENVPNKIILEDLFVVLHENKLYIKLKSKNQVCRFVSNNMLNPLLHSSVYNLLREISLEYEDMKIVERIGNLFENQYVYCPRIVIEDVTVLPEKWSFTKLNLSRDSFESFSRDFERYSEEYKLPKLFYLCRADNRLLLQKDSVNSLLILYEEYCESKILELCSVEESFLESDLVKSNRNEKYAAEFVFSFYKNEFSKPFKNILASELIDVNRKYPPFEDGWLYLKVYCHEDMENDLLISFKQKMCEWDLKDFFYVRYADEIGSHCRIRIKYPSQKTALSHYENINRWLTALQKFGIIESWSICEYRRELNRYGGHIGFADIEKVFSTNSNFTIDFLEQLNEKNQEELCFYAIATLLHECLGDELSMFKLLDGNIERGKYRTEYQKNRKNYIKLLEEVLLCDNEKSEINIIMTQLRQKENILTSGFGDIVLSLLHMCCNRMTRSRKTEEKVYSFLRHSLYDVIKKRQYVK